MMKVLQMTRGSMVDATIKRLHELGINLLAIDFDMTLIDCHTGGRWQGTVEELSKHVRIEFVQLLNACLTSPPPSALATSKDGQQKAAEDDGTEIKIAIVTFSTQIKLVRGVLETIVGVEKASRIPIRGSDRSWSYQGNGSQERKQPYIASAVEELEQQHLQDDGKNAGSSGPSIEITKNTTVLIDDDRKNVKCALEDGVRAIWFNPDKPHRLLQDLSKIV